MRLARRLSGSAQMIPARQVSLRTLAMRLAGRLSGSAQMIPAPPVT